MTGGDTGLPRFVCSALALAFGNPPGDEQAGRKSVSHILGAVFKRARAVSPDVSKEFHVSRYHGFSE